MQEKTREKLPKSENRVIPTPSRKTIKFENDLRKYNIIKLEIILENNI